MGRGGRSRRLTVDFYGVKNYPEKLKHYKLKQRVVLIITLNVQKQKSMLKSTEVELRLSTVENPFEMVKRPYKNN